LTTLLGQTQGECHTQNAAADYCNTLCHGEKRLKD
jgi:hypothetical protein